MDWTLFFSTFSVIFVAELPDKTALATVLMATRGRPPAVFTGVALAFLVQTLVAVAFGSLIGLLPRSWVRVGAGLLFLGFAAHTWFAGRHHNDLSVRAASDDPANQPFFKSAWSAFVVIFIAEWGDLTQLATASVAAHYREELITVFAGALCALWCVSAIAIFVGSRLGHLLEGQWLRYLGTGVFAAVGCYFLWLTVAGH